MFRSPSEERKEERQRKRELRMQRSPRKRKVQKALEAHESYSVQTAQDRVLLEEVQKIWDAYDKDGNGVLDRKEMRVFIREMLDGVVEPEFVTDANINRVFDQFDANGDGEIQQEEMLEFMKFFTGL